MKNLATLKRMNSAIFEARNAYRKAVAGNLMETGELRVKGDDDNEESGYPEGKLLSVPDKHGYMVDCVYDAIKASEKGIEVHICYFDDCEEDCWQWASDLGFDDLDAIIDGIQWPEEVKKGEAEPENLVYVVHEYCIDDYETRWQDYNAYTYRENALAKLRDVKEQDMMPIVEEEGFEVHRDEPTHFEAGREGDYSRGCVCVKVVTTPLLDGKIMRKESA